MTDIEVLEREMECVRRKAQINCTNCGSCDLLMDDSRILAAYSRAVAALRAQKWQEQLWHDAKTDPPKVPGLYYGKKDATNSMWAVRYRDGVWTLSAHTNQKMDIVSWADYTAFDCKDAQQEAEKVEPLTLEELRQMDGQPVFIEHDIFPKFNHVWVIWSNQVSDDNQDGLEGYGDFWRAYRRPPVKEGT